MNNPDRQEECFECLHCEFRSFEKEAIIVHFREKHPADWMRDVMPKIREARASKLVPSS